MEIKMRKIEFKVLTIVMIMGFMTGCNHVQMTDADKERIEYVKETLLGYGMEIEIEVTKEKVKGDNRDTDELLSFSKKQIYELLFGKQDDQQTNYLYYYKFENSKAGKEEAEALFIKLKNANNILPDSEITELTDAKTGNKSFVSRSKINDSTVTSDISADGMKTISESSDNDRDLSVILIYDAGLNEVGLIIKEERLPSDNMDIMADKKITDLGWTYSE